MCCGGRRWRSRGANRRLLASVLLGVQIAAHRERAAGLSQVETPTPHLRVPEARLGLERGLFFWGD
jgi:hypothetical protein